MSMPKETPEGRIPMGPWLAVFGLLLTLGLGYLGTRNLFSGLVLTPPPLVGEWQAYRTPWRIAFNPDKTLVNSTGPSQTDASQPATTEAGTYAIDFFGRLWVTLNNGQVYTATLRADWPNQFDLIDPKTDIVTVFERVPPTPPIPDRTPEPSPGR